MGGVRLQRQLASSVNEAAGALRCAGRNGLRRICPGWPPRSWIGLHGSEDSTCQGCTQGGGYTVLASSRCGTLLNVEEPSKTRRIHETTKHSGRLIGSHSGYTRGVCAPIISTRAVLSASTESASVLYEVAGPPHAACKALVRRSRQPIAERQMKSPKQSV